MCSSRAGETVWRSLLGEYDIRTLLRLPTGIYYAQGVKANVLILLRKPAALYNTPWIRMLRIYDLRTNTLFKLKTTPISTSDFEDFVSCYNVEDRQNRKETDRLRVVGYEVLVSCDQTNLDIFWLRDRSLEGSEDLQPPDVIAAEMAENSEAALEQFGEIHEA
jgi:type I restriction enzyme M protein